MEDAIADGSVLSKHEHINRVLAFVENEIVFKYGLMEKPSSNVSVLRSGQVPSNYRRFICTVVYNLLPKEHHPSLPVTLLRKDTERNGEEGEQQAYSSEEEIDGSQDLNEDLPRKAAAKRVHRSSGDDLEADMLAPDMPKKRKK